MYLYRFAVGLGSDGEVNMTISSSGIPGGFNYTFDPVSCQFKYAWSGDFIDAGPAWNGRGGNPVKARGAIRVETRRGVEREITRRRIEGIRTTRIRHRGLQRR